MNLNNDFEDIYFWQLILFEVEVVSQIASQIYHEYTNKPLDGAYLADFDIDISVIRT